MKFDSRPACEEHAKAGHGGFVDTVVGIPSWILLVDARANAEHVVKGGLEVNCMLHEQFREQRSRLHNALAVFLASKIE
jgi:hypothetical protein